jgi:hypothetical protein
MLRTLLVGTSVFASSYACVLALEDKLKGNGTSVEDTSEDAPQPERISDEFKFGDAEVILQYRETIRRYDGEPKLRERYRRLIGIRGFPSSDCVLRKLSAGYWGHTPHESFRPRADHDDVVVLTGGVPVPRGAGVDDKLLARLAGQPWLESLDIQFTDITEIGMIRLQGLARLEALDLAYTAVTDTAMKAVGGLSSLKILALNDTAITDVGLSELRHCDQLERLYCGGSHITGSAFADFQQMRYLQALLLHGTQLNDEGLGHVSGLQNLRILSVAETAVTDQGAKALSRLRSLQELDLGCTHVSDESVMELRNLPSLRLLYLDHSRVTDTSIVALADFKSLRFVDITGNKLTDAALEELRERHPDLLVVDRSRRQKSVSIDGMLGQPPTRRAFGAPDRKSTAMRMNDFLSSFQKSIVGPLDR